MKAAGPAYVIHLMMSASWQTLVGMRFISVGWRQGLISPPKAPMPTKPSEEDKTIESRPLSSAPLPPLLLPLGPI